MQGSWKKKLQKSLEVKKTRRTFAIRSRHKNDEQIKMVLWFTGYILREKECSIYLSILLTKKRNSQDSNKTFYFFTMESLILAQDER